MPTLHTAACFVLTLSAMLSSGTVARSESRPNVLLVMTDDQGWGDVHSHGNDLIDTPVMDRLATEGARFDRFFVSPLCAPTRASLLTGRYHLRTGVSWVTASKEIMRTEEVTLAEVLQQAGYATGCFGKWHNGSHYPHHPNGQGFDEFFGFAHGHFNLYFDALLQRNGEPVQTKGYISDVITDAALAFIERQTQAQQPFFCYVPYNAPHAPFQVPDQYFDKYRARGLNEKDAAVYGMCENLDDNLGRLLKKLAELKIVDNTIVLFLTDNGPNGKRYNGGMRGVKGSVHEGGVRVPLFIRWPGKIPAGKLVTPIAAHIDLFPTLLQLCNVEYQPVHPLDGRSLVPLLQDGPTTDWPARAILTHNGRHGGVEPQKGSLRTQQYRLVTEKKDHYQLYDMQADPEQKTNIADKHPDVVARLSKQYERLFADVTKDGFAVPPIPVGYAEAPTIELPVTEGLLQGELAYANTAGYAHDWLIGWKSPNESISWEVNVVHEGCYDVTAYCTLPQPAQDATVTVQIGDQSIARKIERMFDPPREVRPDRVPDAERWLQSFTEWKVGEVKLKPGTQRLSVHVNRAAEPTVWQLHSIRLQQQ